MSMAYIYAVWLLHEAGKEINAENMKKVLESAGITPNDAIVDAILSALKNVDLNKVKEESLFVPAQAQPAQTTVEVKKEEEKKEKKEEKKEAQALEGLSALFGF